MFESGWFGATAPSAAAWAPSRGAFGVSAYRVTFIISPSCEVFQWTVISEHPSPRRGQRCPCFQAAPICCGTKY